MIERFLELFPSTQHHHASGTHCTTCAPAIPLTKSSVNSENKQDDFDHSQQPHRGSWRALCQFLDHDPHRRASARPRLGRVRTTTLGIHTAQAKRIQAFQRHLLILMCYSRYPKEWENAVSAWEVANPNVESSEDATRIKIMLAYDLHYNTGKIEAARGIWDAAEEHYEGMWSFHCKKLH